MAIINPYSGLNWNSALQITSCSHEHCEYQSVMDRITANSWIQHLAISNYYPSEPCYPMTYTIPEGCIASPNAEHHNMKIGGVSKPSMHLNSLGSTFQSGSPQGETPVGCGGANCEDIIPQIFSALQYSDAGGLTINHPIWTGLKTKDVEYLLDFDDRVLGMEIFNASSTFGNSQGQGADPTDLQRQIEMWDDILLTGRRCWGFCVADHWGEYSEDWQGRNVLLVPSLTEYNCLRAYRTGAFYGRLKNTNLVFTSITFSNYSLSVKTQNADNIKIIIDKQVTTHNNNSVTQKIPMGATYVRVEAHNENDSIYSNPITLKTKDDKDNFIKQAVMVLM